MKIFLVLTSSLILTNAQYALPQTQQNPNVQRENLNNERGFFTSVLNGLSTGINTYLTSPDFQDLRKLSKPTRGPLLKFQPINFKENPSVPFAKKLQETVFQRAVQIQPSNSLPRQPFTSAYSTQGLRNLNVNRFKSTFLKEGSIVPSRGVRVNLPPIQQPQRFSASIKQAPVSQQQIYTSLTSSNNNNNKYNKNNYNNNNAGSIVKAKPYQIPEHIAYSNNNYNNNYNNNNKNNFRGIVPALSPPAFRAQIIEAYNKAPISSPELQGLEISNAINVAEEREPKHESYSALHGLQTQSQSERAETYGAPPLGESYGAPAALSYGAPAALSYGAPAALSYGAPVDQSYGVPAAQSYGAPAAQSYGAPAAQSYGVAGIKSYPDPTSFRANSEFSSLGGFPSGSNGGGVVKEIYVQAAPEFAPEVPRARPYQPPVQPEIHQQIIFVKAPAPAQQGRTVVELPPQTETKTRVYVLVKDEKNEGDNVRVVAPKPTTPTPPEVFFVRYANKGKGDNNGGNSAGTDLNLSLGTSLGGYQ